MKNVVKFVFTGIILAVLLQGCSSCNTQQKDEITLADASVVWWMAPGIIAQKNNLYEKNGLSVKSFDVQTGLASKNAVISGSADIGLVATSPLAIGAFTKENLIVLGSYVDSKALLATITPKSDENFSRPVSPVAIVKGTISEIYFYKYMKKYFPTEDMKNINQLNVKPPDVINTINSGDGKSAVIWEPFATLLAAENDTVKINRSEEIYTHRIYIVTTPETLQKKRSAIEKFVRTFKEASEFVINDSQKAKEVIKSVFAGQEKSMNDLWSKVDFTLKFDYEKMESLIVEDAETMSALGLTPKDDSGNFRRLTVEDVHYLFNHDFKLTANAGNPN